MSPHQIVAVLTAASLLTGCAVGPDYVRPDVRMPQRFQGQAAIEGRHAAVSADLATWWTGFGDPQLTRFVARFRSSLRAAFMCGRPDLLQWPTSPIYRPDIVPWNSRRIVFPNGSRKPASSRDIKPVFEL